MTGQYLSLIFHGHGRLPTDPPLAATLVHRRHVQGSAFVYFYLTHVRERADEREEIGKGRGWEERSLCAGGLEPVSKPGR